MQKFLANALFWSIVVALTVALTTATFVSLLVGGAGKILLAVAQAVLEMTGPIAERISDQLKEMRPANKLTVIEVTEETFDEYDAAWIDDALTALRSGETVRLDGVAELISKEAADNRAAADEARRQREAWDRMSPVERYMHAHPASEGGPKTVDEALAAMQAEAGRPFDFNDPAVQPVGNVTGLATDGGVLQQQTGPTLPKQSPATLADVVREATHGYEPDVPVAKDGPYDLQAAAKALCDGPVVGFQNPANLPG